MQAQEGLVGKSEIKMCSQGLLLLIGLKVLIMMMTSLQNIAILSAQGLLMLIRSKYF